MPSNDGFGIKISAVQLNVQDVSKQIQKELDKITNLKININDVNTSGIKSSIQKTIKDAFKSADVGNIKMPTISSGDISGISGQYKAEFQQLMKLAKEIGSLEFKIAGLDISKNKSEIATLTKQLTDFKNDYSSLLKSIGGNLSVDQWGKLQSVIDSTEDKVELLKSKLADGFNIALDDGTFDAKYTELISRTEQWSVKTDSVKNSVIQLNSAYKQLGTANTEQEKKLAFEQWNNAVKSTTNSIRQMNAEFAKDSQIQSLNQQIQEFYDKNSAAHKTWGDELRKMLNATQSGAKVSNVELERMRARLAAIGSEARQAGKLGTSFFDGIKEQASKFTQWVSITTVIMKGAQSVRKMVEEIKVLDNAIMDLTMATGYNKTQIESLMDTYFELGEQLSATASDVASSADTWLRQGKSIAETNELIRDSMILSKISGLSAEESTKYLTSAMKGYKVATEDVLGVVDKLSAVDMASATDVGGLAEGMSQVAASAQLAGVSMDKLLGYLASVGEVTQEGMAGVGTAYNAIFARMGNIKLSRLKDYETGEDLSNVETVLRGVGIQLRDSANSFKDFDEVLDETAKRWHTFSEVQQRAIANAFAGTHHVDSFITLMLNYDKALEYTEKSMNSNGQAMEKFAAYEETITAHTEQFSNAFQEMSQTIIDSGIINFFIDLGTLGIKSINGLVEALTPMGTLGTVLGAGLGIKNVGKG